MFNFIELESVASTNEYLKNLLKKNNLCEKTVIIANKQFAGKGQGANTWESKAGDNLTFSILLNPHFLAADRMFLISKMVSVGIVNALNKLKTGFKIKWPNDIYFNNKKVAGILIENQLSGSKLEHSVVGIGLNVNQKDFLSNAPNPVSLCQIVNKNLDKQTVLKQILSSIEDQYTLLKSGELKQIDDNYFTNLYRNADFFNYKLPNKLIFKAKIIEVKDDGKIILLTEQGKQKGFYFKEIQFV